MNMNSRASIHLITRDRPSAVALLLESLLNQTNKQFDIVILDNSRQTKVNQSYECRCLMARLQMEGVRINMVESPQEHRDIGRYRNECIAEDKFNNPIGIRIDDDTILDREYIEIVTNGFTSPDIAVVGGICPYIFHPKTYILQPARFNEISPDFDWVDHCVNFVRFIDENGSDLHWSRTYFPSGHIRSNYAYRMDVAKKLKFPEYSGPSGFTEETFFCIKVWLHSYNILINPNAIAWHMAYPAGGGRDQVTTQAVMEKIKVDNMNRLKTDLSIYRKVLNAEPRGYP